MEDMKKQSLERKSCKKPRREPFRKRVTYWLNRKVTQGEVLRAKGNDRGGWEKKRGYKMYVWGFISKYSEKWFLLKSLNCTVKHLEKRKSSFVSPLLEYELLYMWMCDANILFPSIFLLDIVICNKSFLGASVSSVCTNNAIYYFNLLMCQVYLDLLMFKFFDVFSFLVLISSGNISKKNFM